MMAPVFYIILSSTSLNASSENLPFSPDSPDLPLLLLQPDTAGSEKERRTEQEGWKVMKRPTGYFLPPLFSSALFK